MPLFIPPLVALTAGTVGAVALVRLAVRQVRRVNDRLDSIRAAARGEQAAQGPIGRLRRDPETGDYRPE